MRARKILKWTLGLLALPVLAVALAALWLWSIDFSHSGGNPQATRADLEWVAQAKPTPRGRILAVVSSTPRMLDGRGKAGYELTELSRVFWVFEAAGFRVDIASPEGGQAPMVLDDDLVDADYAFINEPRTREAVEQTLRLDALDPADYVAVYVVGGKGAMLDLHRNPVLQQLILAVYSGGGVIAAVCHGPAALIDIELEDGTTLLQDRRITGFSNAEERFLMEDPVLRLGFLLEDALSREGEFVEGPMYLQNVVVDGRIVTGQNPWSTWALAEATVRALGVEPAPRPRSSEESAVGLLHRLQREGFDAARAAKLQSRPVDNRLLLMHGVIAAMRGEYKRMIDLARLARA
jgi:putative intracellular protease/amidase